MSQAQTTETIRFADLAHFTPKQREASRMTRRYKFFLYGGAMYGGKSFFLRWQLIKFLLKSGQAGILNVRAALFCEDYPTLQDRHLCRIPIEFPSWLGKYYEQTHEFRLMPEFGGGVLCFRNLDDPSKYMSSQFAFIGVDELTKNDFSVFEGLRHRLRWEGIPQCKFIAATNPGGPGHAWVKNYFIDRIYPANEIEGEKFGFLQARATDNPFLTSDYMDTLNSLQPDEARAYRDGDWNVFKGQFFSMWREALHLLEHYQPTQLDQIFGSMDWGFDPDAFAYHLYAVVKIALPYASFNRIITFAELYGTKKYPKEWAELIKELERGLDITSRYADPSAGNRHPLSTAKESGGSSVLEEFDSNGVYFTPGNNDRKNGYQAQRNWLSIAPDGLPYWQITRACPHLAIQMPAAIYDNNNCFLVKDGGEDHAREGSRYFIVSRPFNDRQLQREVVKNSLEYYELMERKQGLAERKYSNAPVGVF